MAQPASKMPGGNTLAAVRSVARRRAVTRALTVRATAEVNPLADWQLAQLYDVPVDLHVQVGN